MPGTRRALALTHTHTQIALYSRPPTYSTQIVLYSFVIPVFRRIFAYFCVFSRVALPRRAIGISCVFGRVGTSCAEYSIQKYYYGIFCIHSVLVRGYSVLGDTLRILQNTPKHVVSSSRI